MAPITARLALLGLVCVAALDAATTLPDGFVEDTIATGLPTATCMGFAPDGRLFVCDQTGTLRIWNGSALTTAMQLSVDSNGERGLLSIEFDPAFASNQFIYLYHTVPGSPSHNQVSRFTMSGDTVAAGSEVVLLDLDPLSTATIHNGGAMHVGADGKLYIAVGENGDGTNSQTLGNLLGKLLRLNLDGSIPSDNPFVGQASDRNQAIWAYGLRNPFTFAIRDDGLLFIDDVGQATWEEIDVGRAGANFGWPITEGATSDPQFVSPFYAYGHGSSATTGCAITGGVFYPESGGSFPASYTGKYFFADYCGSWIRQLDPATGTASAFALGVAPGVVDLDVHGGDLYYLSRADRSVRRIRYLGTATNQPPTILPIPDQRVLPGAAVDPIHLSISDAETPAAALTVFATTSNPTVVPQDSLLVAWTGTEWTLTVSPAPTVLGTATITVSASDGGNTTLASFQFMVDALPDPWQTADVGPVGATGSASYDSGTFTVVGSGSDIGANADRFRFVYRSLAGDGVVIARVASETRTDGSAKSGVMLRQSLDPASPDAFIVVTLNNTIVFGRRTSSAGWTATTTVTGTVPTWLRLQRSGPTITASWSLDGVQWTTVGGADVPALGAAPLVGMVVSAHYTGRLCTGVFDHVAVTAAETAPTISHIVDATTPENGTAGPLAFTVGDAETAPESLVVTATTSNPALLPPTGIVLGGSGAARTVTVTPAANAFGSATVTLTVSDGSLTASDTFTVVVTAVDHAPTITAVPDQTCDVDAIVGPLPVVIGDVDDDVASLTLTGHSSDQTLLPDGGIVIGGSGATRSVTLSPAANRSGTATVSLTVSDGRLATTSSFQLLVNAPSTWQSQDIGATGAVGSTTISGDAITLAGAGADIWGTADAFRYTCLPIVGDATLTVRITALQVTDAWCKAGVMVRESLSTSSAHAFLAMTGANGLAFQRRKVSGGTSTTTAGGAATPPRWLRLKRVGNAFTAYASVDGTTWTWIGSDTIVMDSAAYIGLAVTSHRSGVLCSASFDGVAFSGFSPTQPSPPAGVGRRDTRRREPDGELLAPEQLERECAAGVAGKRIGVESITVAGPVKEAQASCAATSTLVSGAWPWNGDGRAAEPVPLHR